MTISLGPASLDSNAYAALLEQLTRDVQEEMMVTLLATVQDSASACAEVCIRRLDAAREQLLRSFEGERRTSAEASEEQLHERIQISSCSPRRQKLMLRALEGEWRTLEEERARCNSGACAAKASLDHLRTSRIFNMSEGDRSDGGDEDEVERTRRGSRCDGAGDRARLRRSSLENRYDALGTIRDGHSSQPLGGNGGTDVSSFSGNRDAINIGQQSLGILGAALSQASGASRSDTTPAQRRSGETMRRATVTPNDPREICNSASPCSSASEAQFDGALKVPLSSDAMSPRATVTPNDPREICNSASPCSSASEAQIHGALIVPLSSDTMSPDQRYYTPSTIRQFWRNLEASVASADLGIAPSQKPPLTVDEFLQMDSPGL